jgi:hypothetical protein
MFKEYGGCLEELVDNNEISAVRDSKKDWGFS